MGSCFLALQLTCLSEQLQPDVGARMMRCEAQMERFDFFFALHLGDRLYSHTDNLSKDLQGTKMAAVSGQHLTNATKEMLTKIHTDQSFDHFLLMLPQEWRLAWWTNTSKKVMHSGQTGGWCWCTKLPPNCQRSPKKDLLWDYWSYHQGYWSAH